MVYSAGMRARSIALTPQEQADLELVVRRPTSAARDVFRAGVILRAAAGASNEDIAAAMDTASHGEQVARPVSARPD